MGDYGKGINRLRWFFIGSNILFLMFGFLSLGIGISTVYVSIDGSYEVFTGENLISAGILFIVGGFIAIIIAVIGVIGGAGMWRVFLVIYAVAVIIVGLIEIVGAILAFVFTASIRDNVRENMLEAIKRYRFNETDPEYDEDINRAIERVQYYFECCGVDNYTDWIEHNPQAVRTNTDTPPGHCFCDANDKNCLVGQKIDFGMPPEGVATNVWTRGCLEPLEDNLDGTALINGVIGIVCGLIEFAFVVLAVVLCLVIRRNKKEKA